MKNILVLLIMVVMTVAGYTQQTPNKMKLYPSIGSVLEYSLHHIDSMTFGLNGSTVDLYIHFQGQFVDTVQQAKVDSIVYQYDVAYPSMGTMTDARDGEVYETVRIGTQTWMAENLRYNATGSYLNSNNPSAKYGRSYDWSTLMAGEASSNAVPSGVQGICPAGWHVPSDEEWKILEMYLGMSQVDADALNYRGTDEGAKLKSASGWNGNGHGRNQSGFNGLPGGYFNSGIFYNLGTTADFWSSTENSSNEAFEHYIYFGDTKIGRYHNSKLLGFSCRCVKN